MSAPREHEERGPERRTRLLHTQHYADEDERTGRDRRRTPGARESSVEEEPLHDGVRTASTEEGVTPEHIHRVGGVSAGDTGDRAVEGEREDVAWEVMRGDVVFSGNAPCKRHYATADRILALRSRLTERAEPNHVNVPISLIRTEWPPTPQLSPGNPRFDAVHDSLKRGEPIRRPLTVRQDTWTVIDGHHRIAAARLLGLDVVPVQFWTGTTWIPSPPTVEPVGHTERGWKISRPPGAPPTEEPTDG